MKYTILQPVHLGSGPLGEARKAALEKWAKDENCFWNNEPSIGRLLIKLADERRLKMWFFASGDNGSVVQCEDGRYADTVSGDTSESGDAHDALESLQSEGEWWVDTPLLGDFSPDEMAEYVGNK